MRNWYEMYLYGREKAADLASLSQSLRLAAGSGAARQGPAAVGTIVRMERGRDAERAAATFVLQRDDVISIRSRGRRYRVDCVTGRVWATIDGDRHDTLLGAGESMTDGKRGTIVIQALRTATVRIECLRPARVAVDTPMRPALQLG